MRQRFAFSIGLLLAALTAGCGGDIVLPDEGEAASLEIVSGDEQLGPAGATLADQVVVRVLDTRGRPVPNQDVTFSIGSGGGSVAPATVKSDAAGQAAADWTLGPNSGLHLLRVRTPQGGSGSLEETVRATAIAGSGSILVGAGGDEQTGPVSSALADSLVVEATDALGNPVANVEVTWTVSGGGSIDPATVLTGADGLAAAERALGPTAGPQSAQATVVGFTGSPITFTHTAIPANPTVLVKISGDNQTAPGGFEVAEDLVVRLEDDNGNGIGGRSISWVVSSGSGSVSPVSITTDVNGLATTRWTLPTAVGTLADGVSGVFSGLPPVRFTATATADAPTTIELVSGNNQSAAVGSAVANPLVVRVTDANDNPVANVGVTWTAVGGGLVSEANTATDASGLAQVTRTLGLVPGPHTTTAAVDGLTGSPITFTSTATSGPPARLAILTQPGSPTTSGSAFSPSPVIQVQDAQGNAVGQGGIEVTATITSGQPASLGNDQRNTNGNGRATFNNLVITGPPDADYVLTFTASFGGGPLTSVSTGLLTVVAGGADVIVIQVQPSPTAQSGDAFGQQPVVRIEDGSGNPVSGNLTVEVELGQGASNGTLSGNLTASTGGGSTATFSGLSISGETGNYTLLFTSGTLTPDESDAIAITNNPPTAQPDNGPAYTVDEDGTLNVGVANSVLLNDNDPDGDNLTAVSATNPPNGTVVLSANGSFTYTPDPDFNGTDTFTYQANDGQGHVSSSATVTITVNPVNDEPEFNAGTDVSVSALTSALGFSQDNWATGISPGPSDESDSGQTVEFQVSLDDPSDNSAFVVLPQVDPDGTLTFTTLPTLVELTIDVSVVADDGDATSAAQTFTITITIP